MPYYKRVYVGSEEITRAKQFFPELEVKTEGWLSIQAPCGHWRRVSIQSLEKPKERERVLYRLKYCWCHAPGVEGYNSSNMFESLYRELSFCVKHAVALHYTFIEILRRLPTEEEIRLWPRQSKKWLIWAAWAPIIDFLAPVESNTTLASYRPTPITVVTEPQPSPIIAYRVYTLSDYPPKITGFRGNDWNSVYMKAECLTWGAQAKEIIRRQEICKSHVKSGTCECGIYALKASSLKGSSGEFDSYYNAKYTLLAEVELWGSVLEGTAGYRATEARVRRLIYVLPKCCKTKICSGCEDQRERYAFLLSLIHI